VTADQCRDFLHGIVGTAAPALGFVTSFQDQLEFGMRMTSLSLGIIVGLLSLLKLVKKR
jgi:hypothetical protein